jgi:hypothetical protein
MRVLGTLQDGARGPHSDGLTVWTRMGPPPGRGCTGKLTSPGASGNVPQRPPGEGLPAVGGAVPGVPSAKAGRPGPHPSGARHPPAAGSGPARAGTSPWGTRTPVSPFRTESRSPGASLATVGVPHPAASRFAIPHPSLGEVRTWTQERRNSSSFSASDTNPSKTATSIPQPQAPGEGLEGPPVVSLPRHHQAPDPRLRPGAGQGLEDQVHPLVPLEAPQVEEGGLGESAPRGARGELAPTSMPLGMTVIDAPGKGPGPPGRGGWLRETAMVGIPR